jgi:hypothetical protein
VVLGSIKHKHCYEEAKDKPEQNASCDNFEVPQYLIGRRINIGQGRKLDIVVDEIYDRRNQI